MSELMKNAITSIRLGVADYRGGENGRELSAVRNLHAGLLLLAKAVLVRAAPRATEAAIIGEVYVPVPDGQDGVRYEQRGQRTIGLDQIKDRLGKFGVTLSRETVRRLGSLAKLRNAIEHKYPTVSAPLVRETLSEALAVAAELFRHADVDPVVELGDVWSTMLEVAEVHNQERAACRDTFASVEWLWSGADPDNAECRECGSDLLTQVDEVNTKQDLIEAVCRACGGRMTAEHLVECMARAEYGVDDYIAMTDGGEPSLHPCPECSRETYVNRHDDRGEFIGCVSCEYQLGDCSFCGEGLSPGNVSWDDDTLCSYCAYKLSKHD